MTAIEKILSDYEVGTITERERVVALVRSSRRKRSRQPSRASLQKSVKNCWTGRVAPLEGGVMIGGELSREAGRNWRNNCELPSSPFADGRREVREMEVRRISRICTSEHSPQLRQYLEMVSQDFPGRSKKIAPVDFKTGDQSNFKAVEATVKLTLVRRGSAACFRTAAAAWHRTIQGHRRTPASGRCRTASRPACR